MNQQALVRLTGTVEYEDRVFNRAPAHWGAMRPITPVNIPEGSCIYIPQTDILPPHEEDSVWIRIQQFLLGDPKWITGKPREFLARVFRTDAGPSDLDSIGAWREKFDSFYPYSTKRRTSPLFRHAIPWSDGVDNAGHYCIATRALQTFMMLRDDDPDTARAAWDLFVDRALYEAGMIVHHEVPYQGVWAYEKSSGKRPGDFYPRGTVRWSHAWPESVFLFHALTGLLGDVVEKIGIHLHAVMTQAGFRNNQAIYNGHYGPRRCAWLLRALRCLDVLMHPSVTVDDAAALEILEGVRNYVTGPDTDGRCFIRQKPTEVPNGGVMGVWDQWLWLAEAIPWAIKLDGNHLETCKDLTRGLVQLNSVNGQVPYTMQVQWHDSTKQDVFALTPNYTSATHTSMALPALAGMAAMGVVDLSDFEKSYDFVVNALPYGLRGNPVPDMPDVRDLPYGAAAPKIVASLAWGLIPAVAVAARNEPF